MTFRVVRRSVFRLETVALGVALAGKPVLLRAGELENSSASSTEFMAGVWPKLVDMHFNAVLAPVYWELIEPKEGAFDFQSVDDTPLEMLLAVSKEKLDTDARAFAALMAYLERVDQRHTVVMVQVESEVGMIPEARHFTIRRVRL